MTSITDCCGCL
uniref:Uncharacterized protein n=1 Tax=Arundo donax TaxID=35708 RepID=A0A0A9AD76_ARUDO